MLEMRQHRSPRWLNARLRIAHLSLPQWFAVGLAVGVGVLLYLGLGLVPMPHALALWLLFGRLVLAGMVTGVLGVVFYALADERREPLVRQAALYPFRRHVYHVQASEEIKDALSSTTPAYCSDRRVADQQCRPYDSHGPGRRGRLRAALARRPAHQDTESTGQFYGEW